MYKGPEGTEIMKEFDMAPVSEPTPAKPYVCKFKIVTKEGTDSLWGQANPRLLGQQNLEEIIQKEMKKYNSSVELGVELVSLEQFDDRVEVKIHKLNSENSELEEESSTYKWVVGADGARGIVRKLLGLTFLGETKDEKFVIGDIKVEGLNDVCILYSIINNRLLKGIQKWHMWGDLGTTV
jgi:2-polyprenyl-6-methoxyphenol hydroxylase-like FAD-dependent oxidoreductase